MILFWEHYQLQLKRRTFSKNLFDTWFCFEKNVKTLYSVRWLDLVSVENIDGISVDARRRFFGSSFGAALRSVRSGAEFRTAVPRLLLAGSKHQENDAIEQQNSRRQQKSDSPLTQRLLSKPQNHSKSIHFSINYQYHWWLMMTLLFQVKNYQNFGYKDTNDVFRCLNVGFWSKFV